MDQVDSHDDRSLLSRIADGDSQALAALFDRYGAVVFALCNRIIDDRQHAEDVTLSVFWAIWERPQIYQPERSVPRTFLIMMARSRAIDFRRSREVRSRHTSAHQETAGATGEQNSPDESAVLREQRQLVRNALAELEPPSREAVEMAFFEGMTHREISNSLELPLGTVKSRVRDGLQKLRRMLRRHFSEGARNEL